MQSIKAFTQFVVILHSISINTDSMGTLRELKTSFKTVKQMSLALSVDTVIHDILSTARAYSGCPTFTGDYWLNEQQFDHPTWVLLLDAQGTEVSPSPIFTGVDWLKINDLYSSLATFPDADSYVDSQKLLQCLNVYMSTIEGYQQSYVNTPWIQVTFAQDTCYLLPAIPVDNIVGERIYYLIADGNNNWKRLSPDVLEL